MLVYIAGPMSIGPWEKNTREAIDAAADVLDRGHTPIVPHLWTLIALVYPASTSYERCMRAAAELVCKCEALIRLPGVSSGADREVEVAKAAGIPVYRSTIEWSVAVREASYGKV